MTPEEYKALYPQDSVFIQVDNAERTMTDDEYANLLAQGWEPGDEETPATEDEP